MKRFFLVAGILVLAGVIAVPVVTRVLGPRMIFVPPPSGDPIGEFDVPRSESSLLAVRIAAPLDMLATLANEQFPEKFEGSENKSVHKRIKRGSYAWEAVRGEIAMKNTGEGLLIHAPFTGAARFAGELDAKILSVPLDSTAELGGTVGGLITPEVTPKWQIDPQLVPQVALSQAVLNLGGLGRLDISDLLGGSLGQYLQKEARKLTPALKKELNFRNEVNRLWKQAYLTELVSDDPKVWISITPQNLLLAPVDYSDPAQISMTVAIESETYLTNRDPGGVQPGDLPDMKRLDGPASTDLRIPVIVSMSELNEVLAKEDFEFDTGIGTSIEVSGMEAEVGQNGLLNLKLDLQADKSAIGRGVAGEIWVQALPVIDYEKQVLGFTGVSLTVETRDKLTTAAAWLLEGILVKALESQMRVDLNDYKAEIDEEVQKALEAAELPAGIDVSLENLDVNLADIYTVTRHFEGGEPDPGVVIVIRATGDMETRINQLILGREGADEGSDDEP